MTSKEIKQIVDKRRAFSCRQYDQKNYRIGVNSAIYHESAKPEPDNRIPVPFVRRAIKLVKGYFAKVGNIRYTDADGWFDENIKPIYDRNAEELCTAELFEDAATYGSAFELHWYAGDKGGEQFYFGTLPIDQCIPIYTDDLKPRLKEFVWYRKLQDGTECATWYDDTEYVEYRRDTRDGEFVENAENSGRHLYGRVPVIEANVDRDKRNLFDHCLPLIDDFDKRISGVANEHDKFADSILLLGQRIDAITKGEDGKTDVDRLRDTRVMDGLSSVFDDVKKAAAYLERNVNDGFINSTLERNERLIYEMLCIANPNDEQFATASGIAQLYKLLGMEYMVSDIEAYFVRALYARIELIANHKTSQIPDKAKAEYVSVSFKRNLPFDLSTTIQLAAVATGGKPVMSQETAMRLFPSSIIDDPQAEIDRIKTEGVAIPAAPEEGNM